MKTLHVNRCPVIASPAVLQKDQAEICQINLDSCRIHWEKIQGDQVVKEKVSSAFNDESFPIETDPDLMIYSGGFFSDNDRSLMETIRETEAGDLGRLDLPFRDPRLQEMLFRYRARNYMGTLNQDEQERWKKYRKDKLLNPDAITRYRKETEKAWNRVSEAKDIRGQAILSELQEYVDELVQSLME